MDTNIYWSLRGSYQEKKDKLKSWSKEDLENIIIDMQYNDFISSVADDEDNKRVPYIGWYWRHIDFHDPLSIPIGDCGDFIGFMANNKWDYPERYLTKGGAF